MTDSAPPQQGYASGAPVGSRPYAHADDDAFDATPYDYAPYQPYRQAETRVAPPSGPPPAYYRVLNRTYPHSLRPILLLTCFVSLCYLVLLGVQDFKMAGSEGVNGRYKTFTVVQGILFMAAAGIEVLGLISTYWQRLPLARLYSWLSLVAFGAVVASQVIGVIVVFAFKTDVIASCATYYQGANVNNDGWFWSDNNDNRTMSPADANKYCQSLWSRSRTWDIIWLIVTFIVGSFFVLFGFAYARQLADPSSIRQKVPTGVQYAQQSAPYNNGVWPSSGPMGAPYDPDSQYSYPPAPRNNAYQPPPGPPPPPEYKGRPSMDTVDFDAKSPIGPDYDYDHMQEGYEYERHVPQANRPGSSRSVRHNDDAGEEESARRDSGETLRGEDSVKKVQSTVSHGDHDDGTPRI